MKIFWDNRCKTKKRIAEFARDKGLPIPLVEDVGPYQVILVKNFLKQWCIFISPIADKSFTKREQASR